MWSWTRRSRNLTTKSLEWNYTYKSNTHKLKTKKYLRRLFCLKIRNLITFHLHIMGLYSYKNKLSLFCYINSPKPGIDKPFSFQVTMKSTQLNIHLYIFHFQPWFHVLRIKHCIYTVLADTSDAHRPLFWQTGIIFS